MKRIDQLKNKIITYINWHGLTNLSISGLSREIGITQSGFHQKYGSLNEFLLEHFSNVKQNIKVNIKKNKINLDPKLIPIMARDSDIFGVFLCAPSILSYAEMDDTVYPKALIEIIQDILQMLETHITKNYNLSCVQFYHRLLFYRLTTT